MNTEKIKEIYFEDAGFEEKLFLKKVWLERDKKAEAALDDTLKAVASSGLNLLEIEGLFNYALTKMKNETRF